MNQSHDEQHKGKVWQHINISEKAVAHLGDVYVNEDEDRVRYQRFLDSLYFPEIHTRQQEIEDAHRNTFEWIFSAPRDAQQSWDNFIDWLETPQPGRPYWIEGKPGSGKSTLMAFLVEHERTDMALSQWAEPGTPVILSYFFWEAGVPLQKNSVGLLRSLVWHLYKRNTKKGQKVWSKVAADLLLENWTQRRLLSLLQESIVLFNQPTCLFLDGLDEFADPNILLDLIEVFKKLPLAKLCLSGRPSLKFASAFCGFPTLRLEDLTADDRANYLFDEFLDHPSTRESLHNHLSSFDLNKFAQKLLQKSQGVFLWLRLVVQSLRDGVDNEDDVDLLETRLDDIPTELEDLFTKMLLRASKDQQRYAKTASQYFNLILAHESRISLPQFAVAVDPNMLDKYLASSAEWDCNSIVASLDCRKVQTWISARCAGLLEVVNDDYADLPFPGNISGLPRTGTNYDVYGLLNASEGTEVCFIHRTVKEFLINHERGKQILAASSMNQTETRSSLCKSQLLLTALRFWIADCSRYSRMMALQKTFRSFPDTPAYHHLLEHAEGVLQRLCRFDLVESYSEWYHSHLLHESFAPYLPRDVKALEPFSHKAFLYYAAANRKFNFIVAVVKGDKAGELTTRDLTNIMCIAIRDNFRYGLESESSLVTLTQELLSAGLCPNASLYDANLPLCPPDASRASVFQYFLYATRDYGFRDPASPIIAEMTKLFLDHHPTKETIPSLPAKDFMGISSEAYFPGDTPSFHTSKPISYNLLCEWGTLDICNQEHSKFVIDTKIRDLLKKAGFRSMLRVRLVYISSKQWAIVNQCDSDKLLSEIGSVRSPCLASIRYPPMWHFQYKGKVRDSELRRDVLGHSICLRSMDEALLYVGWTLEEIHKLIQFYHEYEGFYSKWDDTAQKMQSDILNWFAEGLGVKKTSHFEKAIVLDRSYTQPVWPQPRPKHAHGLTSKKESLRLRHEVSGLETEGNWSSDGDSLASETQLWHEKNVTLNLGSICGGSRREYQPTLVPFYEAEDEYYTHALHRLELPLDFPPTRRYSF